MRIKLRWLFLAVAGPVLLALAWFCLTSNAKIVGLRNVVQFKIVEQLGGPRVPTSRPPGSLSGIVRDGRGRPLVGATVLVASPVGDTFTAQSAADGRFRIDGVPPGRYVPAAGKRGYDDANRQACLAGLCLSRGLRVRPGRETDGVALTLDAATSPRIVVDSSLVFTQSAQVETTAPLPGRARRTHFTFARDDLRVNDCWLYEPPSGDGPFPTLLLVLPGPVLGWEIIPVPFAAKGYSVIACYPLRGTNIDGDAADLLTAFEYVKQGRLPSHADTGRLGLVAASYTSLHGYRVLGLTDQVDVALVLGGMADGFRFRHDVATGAATAREPFDLVLIGLGFPNASPQLYFKYSVLYHLEGLPPLCVLHGEDDELVPYSQSVLLDEELTRRGMPHEFYSYAGLKHYFSTSADDATTQQMFRDSLDCLRRGMNAE